MAEELPPIVHEHASKPGPITYALLVIGAGIYVFVNYGDALKRFLGLD